MTQNRKPPAFQEYAATTLASRQFRLMTLAERGLYYTLRLECWENKKVPSDIAALAKYLGCNVSEIEALLTENVKHFFVEENGSFLCPELDNYRDHLIERKNRQSEGGKRGCLITNENRSKRKKPTSPRVSSTSSSTSTSNSQVPRQGNVESLVKINTVKQSQNQSLYSDHNQSHSGDEWVIDYESADSYQMVKG